VAWRKNDFDGWVMPQLKKPGPICSPILIGPWAKYMAEFIVLKRPVLTGFLPVIQEKAPNIKASLANHHS